MKKNMCIAILFCGVGVWLLLALRSTHWSFKGLLITPAQQYQYFVNQKEYTKAASVAIDPMQKGVALYLAGEFKKAAVVFGSSSSVEAMYNRGNSYVMLGKYDLAIKDYENVVQKRPEWNDAVGNLELARLRKEKMSPPDDDYGGTDGKLEADEIVIGDRKNGSSVEEDDDNKEQAGSQLGKNEQQALWLKKVQTKPADFLRLKFSYQLAIEEP